MTLIRSRGLRVRTICLIVTIALAARKMVVGLSCYPLDLLVVNIGLACIDAVLAAFAFYQLVRIHMVNRQVGWNRQKVLHLMIGTSNLGYFAYVVSTLVGTCNKWFCWSNVCGFVLMAVPEILFLAIFLLLLSFWVDLCHQTNDEEDDTEENITQQALLENGKNEHVLSKADGRWKCCSLHGIRVGSRQKFVIVVVAMISTLMISFAVIIWIGAGKNPIDSSVVAQVYVDCFATALLILGGALGCYGFLLFSKLRKVRSEKGSSEQWKVAGLAIVSVLCLMSSALVALLTSIPLFYHWDMTKINGAKALVLLILYYFIGSSVPSAFVLWVMRELPTPVATNRQVQSRAVTFISYETTEAHYPRQWAATTSLKNQVSRASPI